MLPSPANALVPPVLTNFGMEPVGICGEFCMAMVAGVGPYGVDLLASAGLTLWCMPSKKVFPELTGTTSRDSLRQELYQHVKSLSQPV